MSDVFSHPWLGGLFGDEEIAALWAPEAQLAHLLAFEAAWSRALGASGQVDRERAESVARAIERFEPDVADLRRGTGQDGLPVPALVAQLKAALGAEGVHSGATSQDLIDTALSLTLMATFEVLRGRLEGLAAALDRLDEGQGSFTLMGRTRMQAATPMTVGDRIAAWAGPLPNHIARIDALTPRIARLQLGGASGNRAGWGDHPDRLIRAMEAAFSLPAGDKAWHAMRDGVGEAASVFSLITGTLGKIGQDIALMAQQGLDEVRLKGGGGSSAMPHKQNPILAELLVTLARFNAVQVGGIHQALVHEQERSGAAWALEWMILPQMALATGRALSAGIELIGSVERIGAP